MKILDQYGTPIDRAVLKEPPTSRVATLENQYLTPMLSGLTPSRMGAIMRAADNGDLTEQHRLFADMEERDAHIVCEMGKRKLAVMELDWDIVPPRNATAAEKANAEWLKEVLTDAVDPFEDLLLALMEGVGHGFAATELEWRQEGKDWLPAFHPRPQEWFRPSQNRRPLHLQDASADGAPLAPFGWVLHTHGKAKTGYLGRMGLYRALVWPFLYKAYGIGDFAEFLETYGLPIVLGKYYNGASPEERSSLMRAVTALGHDARAIMPADMSIEINKVTADGSGTPHLAMVSWAEGAQSKAILGQVLSAEAKATGMGSGVADLHAEVRHDIRNADARQIAGTVTRDLLYPLLALNRGGIDSLSRCPRLVFDTGDTEDLTAYADSLGKLVEAGMSTIPVAWVHERLRIPEPEGDEATLGPATVPPVVDNKNAVPGSKPTGEHVPAALAALNASLAALFPDQATLDALPDPDAAVLDAVLAPIVEALAAGRTAEDLVGEIATWYPRMDDTQLTELLARAIFVAELHGRYSAQAEGDA